MTIKKYKTITLTTESPASLIKKIEKKGIYFSSYAKEIAEKIPKRTKKETFDVGIATVAELGFTSYPTTTELFAKIKELGYDLCPPETALYLRLLEEEEKGTYYWIAMNPISDSGGSPNVFDVKRNGDGKRWLDAGWAFPDVQWRLDSRIVFRLRKSSELGTSEPKNSTLSPSDTLTLESAIKVVKEAGYKVIKEY